MEKGNRKMDEGESGAGFMGEIVRVRAQVYPSDVSTRTSLFTGGGFPKPQCPARLTRDVF